MLHKVTEYLILSLASFCLFSALFRTVAYAQTAPHIEPPLSAHPQSNSKLLTQQPPSSPTPTLFIHPAQTTTTNTTPTPSTTPAPTKEPTLTSEKTVQTTPTPTPTVAVSTKVKTSPTPIPTKAPLPTIAPQPVGSDAEKLFSMVNSYRQSKGLPAFIKDDQVCSLANARATEIAGEMAAGTLHSGMYARNLGYWNTENAAAYGTAEANFNWWLSDGIHRQAIESSKTHSCTACSGIYCVQEFTSFQAK